MDIVAPQTRSRMMSGIKDKHTQPELFVRKFLHAHGFRFRLHVKHMPGKPDLVLKRYKLCIFIHGCFWHNHDGCKYATMPKTRPEFWKRKLVGNRQRDIQAKMMLNQLGWRVFEIWECGIKNRDKNPLEWLPDYIKSDISSFSWPDYICSGDIKY